MEARPIVILSPHLDDAVLSCWHLLSGPADVSVVNVFTGSPPAGSGAFWWDRLTGATDSAERMAERHAEDREALSMAGRVATCLEFLDEQYEPPPQPPEDIADRVSSLLPPGARVLGPAALGLTADHRTVREAALALHRRGQPVSLYADYPHAVQLGWPTWVNGRSPTDVDVDGLWADRFAQAGFDPPPEAVIHHLDENARAAKSRAVSAYRTQLPALQAAYGDTEGFPVFPHEIVWELP
jgi:LmbE family N-acetylglucosaminyl deacetylase